MVALSQVGISVGPLLAGLGVAGFIVGFAPQDILSSFASGMMILLYRPFDVGGILEAGGIYGRVNKMSLVNTTVLTFDNQTLIVPNIEIWGDIIKNLTAQDIRRVDVLFGVSYADDIPKTEAVLQEVVASCEKVLTEPEPIVVYGGTGAANAQPVNGDDTKVEADAEAAEANVHDAAAEPPAEAVANEEDGNADGESGAAVAESAASEAVPGKVPSSKRLAVVPDFDFYGSLRVHLAVTDSTASVDNNASRVGIDTGITIGTIRPFGHLVLGVNLVSSDSYGFEALARYVWREMVGVEGGYNVNVPVDPLSEIDSVFQVNYGIVGATYRFAPGVLIYTEEKLDFDHGTDGVAGEHIFTIGLRGGFNTKKWIDTVARSRASGEK